MKQSRRFALVVVLVSLFALREQAYGQTGNAAREDQGHKSEPRKVTGPGENAPEWKVAGWSDGTPRKLSDYRGKVVVIDFWGVWCGPCRRMIPAIKELHGKYEDEGVIFIGIHSAGTKMEEVKQALRDENWAIPTGIDQGAEVMAGATVRRYGVKVFPTFVIVGKDGRVSYNSSAGFPEDREAALEEMKKHFEAAGVPWPTEKDAKDLDELQKRFNRVAVHMYGLEIERALSQDHSKEAADADSELEETEANAEPEDAEKGSGIVLP